jgi:RNA polymerase sigma factor (sigma-70 family)
VNSHQGDEDYTRLVDQHSSAIMRYALRRWSDIEGCEDVVIETFLVAWRRWDDLPERDRELPWLYGIAFRVLSNQRRSRDRRERLFTRLSLERSEPSDDVDGVSVVHMRAALGQLNYSDRELLQLVYWEELTYRQIAQAIGISENAVGIRITRAKSKLRVFLSPSGDGVDGYLALEGGVDS